MNNNEPLSDRLPGTWLLKSRIDRTTSGHRHPEPLLGEDPVALLIYDRSGHFAAQFMKRERSKVESVAGTYDAYFGTYTVDDDTHIVTQRLMAALVPNNIGATLTRTMHIQGDTLVISIETTAVDGTPVTRTLTWRRLN
jgi:hypothetical protein